MKKEKIIIDTDPGVDDALAIAFGIKALLPILAISSVYGNSTVENCTQNILTILELIDYDVPIYRGSDKPMKGESRLAQSHGDNGLGGFSIQTNRKVPRQPAIEYYQEILGQSDIGDITIVAIGPTTNIGHLIEQSPELFKKIGRIIVMGGVFGEKGNVTPYAEFNVYNDPHALDMLLTSNHPQIIIVPANICRQVMFTQEIFDKITNKKLATGLAKVSQMYIDYYTKNSEYGGFEGGVMYDLLAVALLVEPRLFELNGAKVQVVTDSSDKYGLTEIVQGNPNCKVVSSVNVDKLKELYIRVMNKE